MSFEEKGFEFGEFFLNSDERVLTKNGIEIPLTPKAIGLLLELLKHPGHIVSKDHLMDSVWAGSMVEEANLPFTMGLVRKALSDDVKNPRFIETLSKKGYRFIAPVEKSDGNGGQSSTRGDDGAFENAVAAQPSDLLPFLQRANRSYVFIGAITIIALTLVVVFWGVASKMRSPSAERMTVQHITANGETEFVSASPNGEFLAYVLDKGDYQSLWLYNVATESDVMLSPLDAHDAITAVAFAPDGEHIFYVSSSRLNRIPILGGTPEPILDDVDSGSNVSVSPDGNRVAFLRSSENGSEMDLIVANIKDRSENILASSQRPRNFYSRVAWSPDGKSIASAKRGIAGEGLAIVVLSAEDGSEIQRFKMLEAVSDLAWKNDGTAILTAAYRYQICRVLQYDLSGGNKATTLTDDLISYTSLSMSSDGSRFFAVREDTGANLWIIPVGKDLPPKQITSGFDRFDGLTSITWVSGDRLVFNAQPREEAETDSIRADGSDRNQISKNYSDGISPDGRYLVLGPSHAVVPVINVYDTANGKSEPISSGYLDVNHAVSWDGRWTAFTRWSDDVSVWRVSMSGGEAVRLTEGPEKALWPAISNDGRFVAFYRKYVNADGKSTVDVAYVESSGGHDIKRFAVDAQLLPTGKTAPQWSADGKFIYFARLRDGASNIWKQPIDGSEPTQVTHLKRGRIYDFTFSPDESQVALSYGPFSRDVVQINYR